jgi:hypothetical protein
MNAEREADRLFSRFIRARDGSCQLADATCWGPLECAHIVRRGNGYHATRYEPLNAVALCMGHHSHMTLHPLEWTAWATERLGGATYAALLARARTMVKPDLPSIIADLKRKVP